jgi:hypothetical protein
MAPGGVAVRMIPRMKEWVDGNYPGTKLAITEYNWGALDHINGALAQADVLGIFGRDGLHLATLWGPPTATQPGAFAFRMYRNYDGAGNGFGDVSTQATSTDQDTLAVYAAERSSDNALTVIVINKTADTLTSSIGLAGFAPAPAAGVYRYSGAHLGAIEHAADQAVAAEGFSASFPGNSITLYVIMPGGSPPPPPSVSVTVTPASATVQAGTTQQFTANVTGTTNTSVTWQVNGVTGGNSTVGTISISGLYTAPAAAQNPATVTIRAVSNADATKFGTAAVTITTPPPVTVTVTPTSATVQMGKTQQFTADVTGTTNMSVRWQVNGVTGGNATVGTISGSGLYVAPLALPNPASVTIKAVSSADATKFAAATVTVVAPPFTVVRLISPNGGEVIPSGGTFPITWGAPSAAASFKLYYSLNNGAKWLAVVAAKVTGTSYPWKAPRVTGTTRTCLVKVVGYDARGRQMGADQSDKPFTIEVIKVTAPNGGEVLTSGASYEITWKTNALKRAVAKVVLSYTSDDGTTWVPITKRAGNSRSYGWTPAVSTKKTHCRVRVMLKDAMGKTLASDASNAIFTITPPGR